ncbi:hypothetical protein [Deinococcus radiophilus]|uniref:hypothetical protein n=1 Tax=Deinococcus radiophilus TaxID=32062 RepID=UPI0036172E4C
MTQGDEYRNRNGTEKHEDRGEGDGHGQIGNQQQPDGGARYRDDTTPPNDPGGPGNDQNQGQGNLEEETGKVRAAVKTVLLRTCT